MEKLIKLSDLLLCINYGKIEKAVIIEDLGQMKKLRDLRNKKSVSVYDDNEYALELFKTDGVPGSFVDIQFKDMSELLLIGFYNVEK